MFFPAKTLLQFQRLIRENNKILIISHRRPDADAIGANIALNITLGNMEKDITSACIDNITLENYFLSRVYLFVTDFGKPEDYDLIITVDCGDSNITNYHKKFPNIWDCGVPVINIDHHATNDNFGTINIVNTQCASTTHILFYLFKKMHWKIDKEIADLLMAGLSYDTGHFKHDNTTPEVMDVSGKLIEKGADIHFITRQLYYNIPFSTLKVWGTALSRIKMNNLNIVSSMITEDDVQEHNASINELKGAELITYMNGVPKSKFALLLSEKDGLVKGSLRTQNNDVNVSNIAKKLFNGGGHKKAAGFGIQGKLSTNSLGKRIIEKVSI